MFCGMIMTVLPLRQEIKQVTHLLNFHNMAHFTDFKKEDIQNGVEFSNFIEAILLETAGKEAGLAVCYLRQMLGREKDDESRALIMKINKEIERSRAAIKKAIYKYAPTLKTKCNV